MTLDQPDPEPMIFAWFMDEVVVRIAMCFPKQRRMLRAHMDGVRAQDLRLHGEIAPHHRKGLLKP